MRVDVVTAFQHARPTVIAAHADPLAPRRPPEEVRAGARYPWPVKPRHGYGSRNIYRAEDRRQLDFFLEYSPVESFVQVCCLGEEFSIDVLCDFEGRCLNAIPRTMIL